MKTRKIVAALLAGVAFITCQALADEPFPNWDINRAALSESSGLIRCSAASLRNNAADPHPNAETAKTADEDRAVLNADPQVVFNQYVRWETTARSYIVAHWGQYSEYEKLSAITATLDRAVTDNRCYDSEPPAVEQVPSYITLLAEVPNGFAVLGSGLLPNAPWEKN